MDDMKKQGAIASNSQCICNFNNNIEAALFWRRFGFDVIPIVPLLKQTAVTWDTWLDGLNAEKIEAHWANNPNHEVGFIVGTSNFVLDADSPESISALHAMEKELGITPLMVVTTRRGEHHYFRRSMNSYAKSDAHSTKQHPERIDVKTGRAMVVLPPSTGKAIKYCQVESAEKLFEVEQDFIDRVFLHNGRVPPRAPTETTSTNSREIDPKSHTRLSALLKFLDPEEGGHEGWIRIAMAIHTETNGDDDGLEIFDQWSRQGSTYPGRRMIEAKWRSFASNRADRCNMGTIINRVKTAGHDWMAICSAAEEPFKIVTTFANKGAPPLKEPNQYDMATNIQTALTTPLERYSLRGMSDDLGREIGEQVSILGGLALLGQSTFLYAAPNTGKTLITLALLCEDIKAGRINPSTLYYINVDDNAHGLVEKLSIAEEFGFHMLAEGYNNFRAAEFLGILSDMIDQKLARGVVIALDTTKKFADLMDKKKTSNFMSFIRPFVALGGTVIGMAHTNKHPGSNGKAMYGGTTDLRDDCDCCHTIDVIGQNGNETTVEFTRIKGRGNVLEQAAYRYNTERQISYAERLLSVEEIDDSMRANTSQQTKEKNDQGIIECIFRMIAAGTNTKMLLAKAVALDTKISKSRALKVIDQYTGDNPNEHHWQFSVREHGRKVYGPLAKMTQST